MAEPQPITANSPIKLAIHGAGGRMGQRVLALATADEAFEVVAALESGHHPQLGHDAGQLAGLGPLDLPLVAELPEVAEVVIDFSRPEAAVELANYCSGAKLPVVVATTGFSHEQKDQLLTASHKTALLMAPNMSLAVNLVMKLAGITAGALKDVSSGVDVEILERHHRLKEDAPSGTALKFGEIIASVMGQTSQAHGREGRPGVRPRQEIGYHAIRTGDNPGEHTIVFGMLGETIELRVAASNRDCYAQGALAAAKFLYKQPPGLYSMEHVLGL